MAVHVFAVNNMVNMEELQKQNATWHALEMEIKYVEVLQETVFFQVNFRLTTNFCKQCLLQLHV